MAGWLVGSIRPGYRADLKRIYAKRPRCGEGSCRFCSVGASSSWYPLYLRDAAKVSRRFVVSVTFLLTRRSPGCRARPARLSLCTSRVRTTGCRAGPSIFFPFPPCTDTAGPGLYSFPMPRAAYLPAPMDGFAVGSVLPAPCLYAKRDRVEGGIWENRPSTSHLTPARACLREKAEAPRMFQGHPRWRDIAS